MNGTGTAASIQEIAVYADAERAVLCVRGMHLLVASIRDDVVSLVSSGVVPSDVADLSGFVVRIPPL